MTVGTKAPVVAFIFPGQDAPRPGMGLELAARSTRAAALLDLAAELTGVDVRRALEHGGPALERTSVLQPAITAVLLGIAAELAGAGVHPTLVAGHSLGELAAWSAAGCITAEAAVAAAAERGRLMEREARLHPGGMLALVDTNGSTLEQALALGRTRGRLDFAARNTVDQWVLTGEEPALRAVAARFPSRRLPALGPWHSPLMAGAAAELRAALAALPRQPGHARLIANRTGAPAEEAAIPELLADQLTAPVAWLQTLDFLASSGVTGAIVVGPAAPHAGFARSRLNAAVWVAAAETEKQISDIQERLRTCPT